MADKNARDSIDAPDLDVNQQLKGIPIAHLVGAPLKAACDAQIMLAQSIANFITTVGFQPQRSPTDKFRARQINFSMMRPNKLPNGIITQEKVDMSVPLLSIVPIPNLQVDNVSIDFAIDIETQITSNRKEDTDFEADTEEGGGCFHTSRTTTHGQVTTHKEQTRSTDVHARYSFHVEAKQQGYPEGLMKVLDILNSACAPVNVTPAPGTAASVPAAKA